MRILAIDPGYRQSAYVVFGDGRIHAHAITANDQLLAQLVAMNSFIETVMVLEEMQLFGGFNVGKEIFDSVFWSGRFAQAWHPRPFERLLRSKVRGHLGATKGGDAAVRQALIARFGPYKEDAIGTKRQPGPLYSIKADAWSALAIAVTWHDLHPSHSAKESAAC
jgi:hypothetical protein